MSIAVCGAGSWGIALADVLAAQTGETVRLWARDPEQAEILRRTRRSPRYLTDIELHDDVAVSGDLQATVAGASVVIVAVPTHGMRAVAQQLRDAVSTDAVVVSAAKGFELESGATMSSVLSDELGERVAGIAAVSGPNIAWEIARGLPAATVIASAREDLAVMVRDLCGGSRLRFYSSTDITGVEFAGALKNIIAIGAGICDGIGIGDNGTAAVITRGIAEMTRLGVAAGASPMTFAGLAGVGDCIVTCMSPLSRNRSFGERIGRGEERDAALRDSPMVVEGVNATRMATALAERHGVPMPLASEVHAVLFEGKSVRRAASDLMHRDPAAEG